MRVVQVTKESFIELYDELVVALMRVRDAGASKFVTVEGVKPAILKEGLVDTRMTYGDLADVFSFKNGLDAVSLITDDPKLMRDPRGLLTVASAVKPGLYANGSLVAIDPAQFIKQCKVPAEKVAAVKYVMEFFTRNAVFAEDNAALLYVFVIGFCLELGEVPILTEGDTFETLVGWVDGL